jgi:hypothetical protein
MKARLTLSIFYILLRESRRGAHQKIPKMCKFGNVLCRYDRTHKWCLRRRMNLIEVPRVNGLRQELPDALIQRVFDQQIWASGIGATLIVEGRPFSKSSRSIEIDVRVSVGRGKIAIAHFIFASLLAISRRAITEANSSTE